METSQVLIGKCLMLILGIALYMQVKHGTFFYNKIYIRYFGVCIFIIMFYLLNDEFTWFDLYQWDWLGFHTF